jgi:enterochelin esterase-like enzyme
VQPDSLIAMSVAVVGVVLAAVATAWGWDHARNWWRWPVRSAALVVCATTALASAGIAVNHELHLYSTWGSLLTGSQIEAVAAVPAPMGNADAGHVDAGHDKSQVVQFTVAGQASGITMPAFAYLPPGYASGESSATRYPVVEAFDGFPGSPNFWLKTMRVQEVLDQEIAAGRMAPTVVIFPYQTQNPAIDTECVDAVGGAKFDTFLTTDVRTAVTTQFQVRTDRNSWGTIGTSTGGFCAVNLALRHPDLYAAAASLSGYFEALTDKSTGDLYRGDDRVRKENSPLWRLRNLPLPTTAVYLSSARDDKNAFSQLEQFQAAAKGPVQVTADVVPQGGHSSAVWRAVQPSAFDWLSGRLTAPQM